MNSTMEAESVEAYTSEVDYPLTVVTVGGAGELSGCLVGFVTQCSISPIRFLVCLSKDNHTYSAALRSSGLAIHLLRRDQIDLAALFAEETGDCVDKFRRCHWHTGASGAPILEECAAWLDGVVVARFAVGDHDAFIVEPLAGGQEQHDGLLMFQEAPDFQPGHPADAPHRP
jgi:flavin reductase (DIM6/NTAB) family NADH-FMN oxidoreductase RutF